MAESHDDNPALFEDDDNRVGLMSPYLTPLLPALTHTHQKQAVYIFAPAGHGGSPQQEKARPVKRRKFTSKRASSSSAAAAAEVVREGEAEMERAQTTTAAAAAFPPLFGGKESVEAAALRRQVFDTAWPVLDGRIKVGFISLVFFV